MWTVLNSNGTGGMSLCCGLTLNNYLGIHSLTGCRLPKYYLLDVGMSTERVPSTKVLPCLVYEQCTNAFNQ